MENKATGKEPVVITADSGAKASLKLPNPKVFLSVFALVVLVGGVGAGVYLSQKPQDITPSASEPEPSSLPAALTPKNKTATPSANLPVLPPPPISTQSALIASESAKVATASANTASGSGNLSGQTYDFNGDTTVNSVDLSVMYSGWGTPTTENQKVADLNHDGVINGIDYSLFLPHFRP